METSVPVKLKTNLNTNFIKIIAIAAMTIDHVGTVFSRNTRLSMDRTNRLSTLLLLPDRRDALYPRHPKIRPASGRFCLDLPTILDPGFHADNIPGNLFNLNIFFTLLVSLLATWGFKERKWWLFLVGLILLCAVNFDYAQTGLILMLIFYLCRNKPWLGFLLYTLSYLPALNGSMADPLSWKLEIMRWVLRSFFACAAVHFSPIGTDIRLSKWFFYLYYPAHLLAIFCCSFFCKRTAAAHCAGFRRKGAAPQKDVPL